MKNNKSFENFIRDFNKIKMTSSEKEEIFKRIIASQKKYIESPYLSYKTYFKKTLAFSLVFFLLISLSKPASASSLPGDILYKVKIIHEEIEVASIKESEKKVSFEIKRTERRIKEAVSLAKEKKLNKEAQKKLAKNIQKQVKEIAKKLDTVKKENPEKALALNAELKTTLKVSVKALKEVTKKKEKEFIARKTTKKHKKLRDTKKIEKTNQEKKQAKENEKNNENLIKKATQKEEENTLEEKTKEKEIKENIQETAKKEELENKKELFEKEAVTDDNLLIQSIDVKIQETEEVAKKIEKEIIKKEEVKIEKPEEKEIIKDDAEKITEEDVKKDKENISKKENIQIPLEEKNTSTLGEKEINQKTEEDGEINLEETEKIDKEEIKEALQKTEAEILSLSEINKKKIDNISTTDTEINKNNISQILQVKKEIDALENISEAEDKLRLLLKELSQRRQIRNSIEIEKLIQAKQFGKAYIALQKEIDLLSEIKKTQEIEEEFDIHIEKTSQEDSEKEKIND